MVKSIILLTPKTVSTDGPRHRGDKQKGKGQKELDVEQEKNVAV